MMDRADFGVLMNFAKGPSQARFRAPAAKLLAVKDAASWTGGPDDFELRELILKAGWNTLQKEGAGVYVWSRVLEGLLNAAQLETVIEPKADLKEPDETWVRPRPDQGGD